MKKIISYLRGIAHMRCRDADAATEALPAEPEVVRLRI